MAQIFGKSSNSFARVSLVGGFCGFFGVLGAGLSHLSVTLYHIMIDLTLSDYLRRGSVPGNPDKSWQHGTWPAPVREQLDSSESRR